ncbi:septal ring lytic transglycosylase RlpA family protein [Alginatibacterium sediminis]|uniref:Endolytic peptidoglycan transglycosylase RlpA n=1 Tax=Alginatibacterium sediminis TaxID=2164068 RepID=A0A420E5M9_9ALTE|nr:septal ring lytic transglycosylase RlpA family protein [Alginatibacterium sediminis]
MKLRIKPNNLRLIAAAALSLILAACSSKAPPPQSKPSAADPNAGRYSISQDIAPDDAPKLDHLENPVPRAEPLSKGGNRDYTVRGIAYKVWRDIESYEVDGIASWYGKKFHGHLTSNGEIYDMYSFSAAHKNLPLPSYVEVTNLANGKSVIVRVNDRGPFHSKREIDLSYAAAYKLDMLANGTAKVRVKLIRPDAPQTDTERAYIYESEFLIQLAASKNKEALQLHQRKLQQQGLKARIVEDKGWQKLQLGPYVDNREAVKTLEQIREPDYKNAFIIEQNLSN